MTLQFDPSPGPPFCGWGRYEPSMWPFVIGCWVLLGLLILLLWGR